jgi:hypothetical protein
MSDFKKQPLNPVVIRQRQQFAKAQLLAEIEALSAQADQLPAGDPRREELVARIAKMNVDYQAED